MADRFVDGGTNIPVRVEQRPDALHVAGMQRAEELLHRRLREGLDLLRERGPACEAVSARDDELRISEREMIQRRRLRVQRSDACQRIDVTGPRGAQQVLRALVLHLEVGSGG